MIKRINRLLHPSRNGINVSLSMNLMELVVVGQNRRKKNDIQKPFDPNKLTCVMHIFIHAYKRVGMFLVIQFYVQWTNHEVKSFRSSSGQYSRFYCNVWVVRVRITYYLTLRSLPLLYNQPYSLTWLKVSFLLSLFTNHTESLPHSRVHTYSQCFFFFSFDSRI